MDPFRPSYVVKKAASVTFETVALLGTCEKAEAIRNPRVQTEASAAFPMTQDCLGIGVSHQE